MQQVRTSRFSAKISALLVAILTLSSLPLAPKTNALVLNQLSLTAPTILTEEGSGGTLLFSLNRKLSEPVVISYEIAALSSPAQAGVDFTLPGLTGTTGTFTMPANTLSFPVQISPIDDSDHEGTEMIQINITGQTSASGVINFAGATENQIFLIDNDNTVRSTLPSISFDTNFSAGSEDVSNVSFTVSLSQTSTSDVTFDWSTDNWNPGMPFATTDENDYNNPSNDYIYTLPGFEMVNHATIPAGASSFNINFIVNNDLLDELDEEFVLGISNIQQAEPGATLRNTYKILDNDTSLVSFASAESSDVTEGPGTQTYQYEINLSNPSDRDITFSVDAVEALSSATFGTDWDLTTPVLTIPAGQTKTDVFITVNDDTDGEADETATVRLRTNVLNNFVGTHDTHTFVIKTNDDYVAPVSTGSSGGGYGTAIPQSTASVGGVAAGSVVVTPAPVVPAPTPTTPAPVVPAPAQENTGGQVLGVQTSLVHELIAKLKFGSTSDEVRQLQVELQKLGFFPAKAKTTRYYGVVTRAAVQKYLNAKFDTMSLGELVSVLKFGQKSNAVKKLQNELKTAGFFPANSAATGFYGNLTKQAVANYLAR